MGVTTAQFEAMKPVTYKDARRRLRTGDILLFHSAGLKELVELATHSLWCHASLIWCVGDVDRVLLLESVDKYGVRVMPVSTRINGSAAFPRRHPGKLLVLRHPDFPLAPHGAEVRPMTKFALDRLGYPYSTEELLAISLRIAAGVAGETLPGRLDPKNHYICSEYVAKCFAEIGIDLAPNKEGFIAPADIADDPKVEALFSLLADPEGAV